MTPVVIASPAGDCVGIYRPAPGPAVLMCPAFGDEALKTDRVWRDLAVELAEHGIASLRVDLPGTGNSAGEPDDPGRVQAWRGAIRACADWLQGRHDGRVILFGYRFGALMALDAAARGIDAERLVLLDPPASGAALVRYWRGRARLAGLGAPPEGDDFIQVGGAPLSSATLDDLARLPTTLTGSRCPPALLVVTDGVSLPNPWPDRLRAAGSVVETISFEGYDAFVHHDAFRAKPPLAVLEQLVAYLAPLAPDTTEPPTLVLPPRAELRLPGATETAIRFGPGNGMFGIMCQPNRSAGEASAVLLPTTGVDPCSGLSRMWTDLARRLAREGIASLRFDMRGVGESEGSAGDDLLVAAYHRDRMIDVRHGIDALEAFGFAQVTVVAYCSGAYAAWHAALADQRITGLLAGNLLYLTLQRTLADDVLRLQPGSSRLGLERGPLARLLPARGLAALRRIDDRVRRLVPTPLRRLLRRWEADQIATRRHVKALIARGCAVGLVMAQDDHGHVRLRRAFGERLRLPPGIGLAVIPGADHQFSNRCHRAQFLEIAVTFALRRLARAVTREAPAQIRILETA